MSALPKPIVPDCIVACVDTANVEPVFNVFVFEPATDLLTVAIICNSASA